MQEHHLLLQTIYDIVKNDPQPEHYGCRPRELILRQLQEWSDIHQQLQQLRSEELITMEQQDTLIIRITAAGLEKAKQSRKRIRTNL
jgi:Mn-dependent DtxR family transcriptional regulator